MENIGNLITKILVYEFGLLPTVAEKHAHRIAEELETRGMLSVRDDGDVGD